MSRSTLQIVMLVSCAHALVHVYEVSLPSVEMEVAAAYYPDDAVGGKRFTGLLSTTWRLPWGLGAMLAGWLVDRYGSRRMLSLYLVGCSVICFCVGFQLPPRLLFVGMFLMGAMASIYHPAGLALISHSTTDSTRTRALGVHGIFGSAGIASAPMIIGLLQSRGLGWHTYYMLLAIPGTLLGLYFLSGLRSVPASAPISAKAKSNKNADWSSFFVLTGLALLQGLVYSGVISFLPRYISGSQFATSWLNQSSAVSMITAGVLLLGCIGQYLAGWMSHPSKLEKQLTLITLANAPLLAWMALAVDGWRVVAAGTFAIVHFMHQPIYNSLIAKYTPANRRSLCYGFSFAMGLGLGSFGAGIAGFIQSERLIYFILASVSLGASIAGAVLWRLNALSPKEQAASSQSDHN